MNFDKLNEYLERSFEYGAIKEIGSELPVVYLDDSIAKNSMWFLDLGAIHRNVCESVPYIYDIDVLVNKLMRRKRINFVPFEYKGEALSIAFKFNNAFEVWFCFINTQPDRKYFSSKLFLISLLIE